MSYYWDSFFADLSYPGVPDPETGNVVRLADLADLSPRDLIRLYTEWLTNKGAMR